MEKITKGADARLSALLRELHPAVLSFSREREF